MKYTLLKNKLTGERSILVSGPKGGRYSELTDPIVYAELRRKAIANRNRADRDQVMRDTGLVKTPYGWE